MKKNKLVLLLPYLPLSLMFLLFLLMISISYAEISEQDFSKICSDLSNIDKTELNEKLTEAGIDPENTTLPYIYEACNNLISTAATSVEDIADKETKKIKKKKEVNIRENKIIENKGKGRIKFDKDISVDVTDVEENPNVFIENNLIAINSEELPELNEPATLVIENLYYRETPKILYSKEFTTNRNEINSPCPEDTCFNISYDPVLRILTFAVSHFSSFTTVSSSCPTNYTDCNGDGAGTDADGCENPYPKCSCLDRGNYYSCTNYAWFWNYDGKTSGWCVPKTSSWFGWGIVIDSTGEKGGFPDCGQSQYCCFDFYSDFRVTCGNGVCDANKPYYPESNGNCPKDCYVGDGVCDPKYENPTNDPNDCCTDLTQCNTLQYCNENNLTDCNIKKSSEITGNYNFKELVIDSSATLKAVDNVVINAENVKIYGKVLVDGDLVFNLTGDFELYGVIDGTKSKHTGFEVIGEEKYYCAPGSAVDMSGDKGVDGAKGISGAAPTSGGDGTDGKAGKPITIDVGVLEGECKFISNGGRGGDGGLGGSGGCVGSTESSNYCDGGLCSCSGDPNGKDGGIGGGAGNGGTITINAKLSKASVSAIANGGNAGLGGRGGDGSRGPTTGRYTETVFWWSGTFTVNHILYDGGDSGSGKKAGKSGDGGIININFDRYTCNPKAGSLSANAGDGGNGGDAGKPADGSGCFTHFTSSCFSSMPGKAGLAAESSKGGNGGSINIKVNRNENIPAINSYSFSTNGGNGGSGGNGARGAYSCYNNRAGACRYPGCTEASLMTGATDGKEGSNGGDAGSVDIEGFVIGCSKFSLNGGNGGSGGKGGDAKGNTGSGSNAGNGGDAGTISGLKESLCENTVSLNGGNAGNGGDAGNSASCLPGSHCSTDMCNFCGYYYEYETGISGNGGDAGDGGKAGSCSDCNTVAKGGKGGIAGKGGKDYGEGCYISLISSYCGKPCKPSGIEGIDGVDKDSASFTNTNTPINKTCLQRDLSIRRIEPIQVIEGADLVANKPVMVRVFPALESEDVDEIQNVKVRLTIIKEDGTKVSKEKEMDVKKEWTLQDEKNGENSFNFFKSDGIPQPTQKGIMRFYAQIDPDDEIIESNEDNNYYPGNPIDDLIGNVKVVSVNVQKDNSFNIRPVVVYTYPLDTIPPGATSGDSAASNSLANSNVKFMKEVYPFEPARVTLLPQWEHGIAVNPIYFRPEATSYEDFEYRAFTVNRIFNHLQKIAKDNDIDLVIGFVKDEVIRDYDEFLSGQSSGYIRGLSIPPGWFGIGGFDKVVLLSLGPNQQAFTYTAAHEYGHIAGLEHYKSRIAAEPAGPATPGWCLDQDSAVSCDPKIYINVNPHIQPPPPYYDIMGSAEPQFVWMSSNAYNTLYNRLTN